MTHRTINQMFGKTIRDLEAAERARREDQADRERRAAEAEARLDEPLTRREVLDALESVTSALDDTDVTSQMLRALMEALR